MHKDVLNQLADSSYFTTTAISQLTGLNSLAVNQQLYRWNRSGKIIRLKRGYFMTNQFYYKHINLPGFLEMVSTIIQPFSYISRGYILQEYQMLTDMICVVTAVTSKNTQIITNKISSFDYRHIKISLVQEGVFHQTFFNIPCTIAKKAKALFDYLYLRPLPMFMRLRSYNIVEDLRLNMDDWSSKDHDLFSFLITSAKSAKMEYILQQLTKAYGKSH